jgi:hypothetical protein
VPDEWKAPQAARYIATVHDFDTQEGIDFLVMKYVPGVSVADTLARGPHWWLR